MHYTATQIALLIQKSPRYVKDRMKAGDFGRDIFLFGGEFVTTASAVNDFMERHRFPTTGIPARTEGEYRRKVTSRPVQ